MNVQDVIDTVLTSYCGDQRLAQSGDRIISGSAETEVTGIITTFMATAEVIEKALERKANLIITHEPTYFMGDDQTDWLRNDPVYAAKKKLLDDCGLCIWRFHDHMHLLGEDMIYSGLLWKLGLKARLIENQTLPLCYEIEEMSFDALVSLIKEKWSMQVLKTIGKPEAGCRRIGILVGAYGMGVMGRQQMPMELMRDMRLDAVICGEVLEWTLCAYVNDAQRLGFNKALIVAGHERSEEWGMEYLAQWLAPKLQGMPVTFIDAGEPFSYR